MRRIPIPPSDSSGAGRAVAAPSARVARVARAVLTVLAVGPAGASCAGKPPPVVAVAPPPPPPAPPPPLPAWTFWKAVEVPVVSGVLAAELPVEPERLVRTPAAEVRWSAAPRALREAVAQDGFAVTRPARPGARLGDFYAGLRDDRVPWVVTLDALFFITHLALDRAHADLDETIVAPSLGLLLRRLDAALAEGNRAVRSADLAPAYLVARGIVAVALALADPGYRPAPELTALVQGETARVLAHSAVGVSPWLGLPIDYSGMSPRGQAGTDEVHVGWFRAVAWLQNAALALEGAGERDVRAKVDVATARTHARAVLLLSQRLLREVDPEAEAAWSRVDRAGHVFVGDEDDATVHDVAVAASAEHLDLAAGDWFASVARVDRVRHACARLRESLIYDGAGGATAPAIGLDPSRPIGRIAPTFRLVASRATPDSVVLQGLVFPLVGPLATIEPPPTARDRIRALPSALDVVAWLGSQQARVALHDAGDDAYARYATTLDTLARSRPRPASIERHRTPYLSFLDAIEVWLAPSVGDRVQPGADGASWRARKAEVALGAWTELRHDAVTMARVQVESTVLPAREPAQSDVPVFVEPHPEAIAALLALVRQTSGALEADGAIVPGGPAVAVLDEVQDILWNALGAAVHEAADQALPAAVVGSLAALPGRLRALEAALGSAGGADVPLAVDVHSDVASARVLEEAIGRVDEGWYAMREPVTHRVWLAVGASIPHSEVTQPMAQRLSDPAWAVRLIQDGDPAPESLERAYFVGSR